MTIREAQQAVANIINADAPSPAPGIWRSTLSTAARS